jgi:excisionase family DNA binding protein
VTMPDRSLTYDYLLNKYGLTISWQDAARELGVYWENLRKMCQRGEIRAQKVGRAWLLTTKALADYIDHGPAEKLPPAKNKRRERLLSP